MSQGFVQAIGIPLTVNKGGTGLLSATAYAVLCGGTTSTGNFQSVASVGTSGQPLVSNGASNLPTFQTLPVAGGGTGITSSKAIVQQVYTQTGAVATGTTATPADDTIPQNTEGDEYMTLAITPSNSSNLLVINAEAFVSSNTAGTFVMALFQDSTANALAAMPVRNTSTSQAFLITLQWIMAAGTTSSTTFKIRIGNNNGGTTTFNGLAAARILGGVANSFIRIQEIVV